MSRRRVRVLVVDDSPLSVVVLASRIARDPRFEVVGIAYDGLRAVELAKKLRPSVITMDLNMPKLDGLKAIERVMKESPTRILVVTGQDDRGTLAFEALRRGACDLLEKPRPHEGEDGSDILCERIWAIARAPFGTRPSRPSRIPKVYGATSVTAIGLVASTGGPASLATILGGLPADFPAAILVVQHLPPGFAARLARWLDGVSPLSVALATEGERLQPGRVLIAGDDRHLTVDSRSRVRLVLEAPVDGHRPSGTRLLASLADALGPRAAGVVLTGMGRDGAAGLAALRRAGGRTAAQDEATSVVYGMPRAALDARAAEASIPLENVAPYLLGLVGRGTR